MGKIETPEIMRATSFKLFAGRKVIGQLTRRGQAFL